MKLNFWQWLGILFLIGGAIGYIWLSDSRKRSPRYVPAPTETTYPTPAEAPAGTQ